MPKKSGSRAGSAKKNATPAGRIKATFSAVGNWLLRLGGKIRIGRGRRPKGTSGRAGGSTSRRMAQSGHGGR